MALRTYGVYAHKRFTPSKTLTLAIEIILVIGLVIYLLGIKKDPTLIIFIIFALYFFTLFIANYKIYSSSGRNGLALHGRYAFNVLPLLYLTIVGSWFKFLKQAHYKAAFVLIVLVLFTVSNIPSFIYKTSPVWFSNILVNHT